MQAARPQVILLNSSYAPSLLRFRGKLIEALVAGGHNVHLAGPDIEPDLARQLESLGATVHELPLSRLGLSPWGDLKYTAALCRLIRRIAATLIFNYTIKPNIWGAFAGKLAGCRSVSMVTGLGYAFAESGSRKQRLIRALTQKLYAVATSFNHKVIFQNPDDLNDFKRAGCLSDPEKAFLVNGSGIDISEFSVAPLPEAPVFLMIARFLKAKGLREYGTAVAELKKRRRDCQYLLAGFPDDGVDGLSEREMNALFASGIDYLGHLDDVKPALARSSIYVLPSYREGTPRTVLEALAMGRAVITTDAPGCRETVRHEDNGLLVEVGNSADLADAMNRLADDPELVKRMGNASREIAVSKYDVVSVNKQLMACLDL